MSTAGRSSPSPRGEVAVPPSLDRASAADLMQFATGDGRAAGHIGAVLVLDAAPAFSVAEARRLLGDRIRSVPRLRQRLYRAPPGCGRPYWADDPAFDVDEHVRQACCPPPGDERALLDLAAAQLGEPHAPVPAAVVGHVRHWAGRRRHRAARHHGPRAGGRHRWACAAWHAGRPGRRDGRAAGGPVPGTGTANTGNSPSMPGEVACTGPGRPNRARRARRVACAGSATGSQSWAPPGRHAGCRPHRSTGQSGRGGGSTSSASTWPPSATWVTRTAAPSTTWYSPR